MQNWCQLFQIYFRNHSFGKFQTSCNPLHVNTNRILLTKQAISICEKYVAKNQLHVLVHILSFKLSAIKTYSVGLFSQSNSKIVISCLDADNWSLQIFKHPNSQIICLLLKSTEEKQKDFALVSSFTQQLGTLQSSHFPTRFYDLALQYPKIHQIQYIPQYESVLMILYKNNMFSIYNLWDNLSKPLKTIKLTNAKEKQNNIMNFTLSDSSPNSHLVFVAKKGTIYSLGVKELLSQKLKNLQQNGKLLYFNQQNTSQSLNQQQTFIMSFTMKQNQYYLNVYYGSKHPSIKIFSTYDGVLSLVHQWHVTSIQLSQKHKSIFDRPSILWQNSQSILFLVLNQIFILKCGEPQVDRVELKLEVLVQILSSSKVKFVAVLFDQIFLITSEQKVNITLISIKLKLFELQTSQSKNSPIQSLQYMYSSQDFNNQKMTTGELITKRLFQIYKLKHQIHANINSTNSIQQVFDQINYLTQKMKLEFEKSSALGQEILQNFDKYNRQKAEIYGPDLKREKTYKDLLQLKTKSNKFLKSINYVTQKQKLKEQILLIESLIHQMDSEVTQNVKLSRRINLNQMYQTNLKY